jgi:hypothetical protein
MLFAHAQLPRGLGVRRDTDEVFARRVDEMLGCDDWREAYQARKEDELTGEEFRAELTNWMRWRLEKELGYAATHAFELRNVSGSPVYSMVFATDNAAGNRIMSHLYAKAADEHPKMREDALARRRGEREEDQGELTLFPPMARTASIPAEKLYQPEPPRVPYRRAAVEPRGH